MIARATGPRTWIVDDDGPADFHTIQEAINAASDGDTVFVKSGTYYENVMVNKSVTIISENDAIIDGNGGSSVFYVDASKVTSARVIDVKTGEKPGIRISNFEKMLQMKGFNKVGFALVPETKQKRVYLLEYRKMSLAGIKAAETRKKNALRKNK